MIGVTGGMEATSGGLFSQSLMVYRGVDLTVTDGVALGDSLTFAAGLLPDDYYTLDREAAPARLSFAVAETGRLMIAPGSSIGTAGHSLHVDSVLLLLDRNGRVAEVLLLVEEKGGIAIAVYALPLSPLNRGFEYRLAAVTQRNARHRLFGTPMLQFTHDTLLTLADGSRIAASDVQVGQHLMSGDGNMITVNWIGRSQLIAARDMAPVLVPAGSAGNQSDLILGPRHRIRGRLIRDMIGRGNIRQIEPMVQHYVQILPHRHRSLAVAGVAVDCLMIEAPPPHTANSAPVAQGLPLPAVAQNDWR